MSHSPSDADSGRPEVHRDQRGRARRLDVDARPAQAQLVRGAGRQVVLVVAEDGLEQPDRLHEVPVRPEVLQQVGVEALPGEHADLAAGPLRVVARVFERLPRGLQEQALLRIEDLGLARGVAEEAGVEEVDPVEHRLGADVPRPGEQRGVDPGLHQLLLREEGDQLGAGGELLPEVLQVARPREPPRQPDHRHRRARRRAVLFVLYVLYVL